MLIVRGLKVRYGPVEAVHGVNLQVADGVVTIVGANGAGKSSALKAIVGLAQAAAGQIEFGGEDITHLPSYQRALKGIALVPEGRRVFPHLTVWENLLMGGFTKRKEKAALKAKLEEVTQLFPRLVERRSQLAGSLSGGEQQMVAIGRAMMSFPRLLLLDEPSMGLAPKVIDQIGDALLAIAQAGTPMLLVEQNSSLALSLADYVYVMELGAFSMQGPADEVADSPELKSAYLGRAPGQVHI